MFMAIAVTVLAILACVTPVSAKADKVALIAAKGSGIEELSIRDVRRVYLGLKSAESKVVNKPVLNTHSRELYDDFLKNVMHMTEGSYKRKLVKRIFRQGAEEIRQISSYEALNDHLLKNVGDISFAEVSVVKNMENIEVIQILW